MRTPAILGGIVFALALVLAADRLLPRTCAYTTTWSPADRLVGHDAQYAGSSPDGIVFIHDATEGKDYQLRYTCQ